MKLQKLALLSVILVFCCSCAKLPEQPKPRQMVSAKGKVTYLIKCYKKDGCTAQAEKLCPNGYAIVRSSSGPFSYDSNGSERTITQYEMEIGCN
jgi:hypothetical protein